MTQEEIIGMVQKAGAPDWWSGAADPSMPGGRWLADVVAQAVAAEREACAQACDALERRKWESMAGSVGIIAYAGVRDCARAIRARGGDE